MKQWSHTFRYTRPNTINSSEKVDESIFEIKEGMNHRVNPGLEYIVPGLQSCKLWKENMGEGTGPLSSVVGCSPGFRCAPLTRMKGPT
jgi:hypothetical protein